MESRLDSKVPKLVFFVQRNFSGEEEDGVMISDIHCILDSLEKTQQVSFGIVPKGTGIMLFFNLFFFFWGRKGKHKVW